MPQHQSMETAIVNVPFLLGALVGILILVFVVTKRGRGQKRIAQSSLPRFPETKCVRCGKKMEEGFVAIGGMGWRSFDSSPPKFTSSGEKLKNICPDQSLLVFNRGVPENRALRCTSCSLVLIDHSQLFVFSKKGT